MRLTIPLYCYPTDEQAGIGGIWDAVADAGSKIPITVIFGVSNHPVGSPSSTYVEALEKLHQSNIQVLAYVATDMGQRDINEVKDEIDDYATNFDIDGIFLDEGLAFDAPEVSDPESLFAYYEEVTAYAKTFEQVKEVMLNISYIIKEDIERSSVDSFIVYENFVGEWATFDPSQYNGLDYSRLHIIVHGEHGDMDTALMQNLIQESADNNITNVYFTDNEFKHLPSFWYDEVATLKAINDKKRPHLSALLYLLF